MKAATADTSKGAVPDFFIVGHPKCGTTALYEMLRAHPQVFMPDMKEPWFFATELLQNLPDISTGIPAGVPRTIDEYLSLFEGAEPGQLVGEATALYLWSRVAARGIAELRPDARIVAVLREPASFLRSLHLELVQQHQEPEQDLRKAISVEQARRRGDYTSPSAWYWPTVVLYSDYVRYVEQLRRYQEFFPPEQILVLIYDDFRNDNDATMRIVQRFLGVDDTYPIQTAEANPTVRVRSMYVNNLLRAVSTGAGPVSGAIKTGIEAVVPQRLRGRALEATQRRFIYAEPEPADEQLMAELRRRYKPEVAVLSEHLGRDLVGLWGYEEID
jgi:Sulfotransferase domain